MLQNTLQMFPYFHQSRAIRSNRECSSYNMLAAEILCAKKTRTHAYHMLLSAQPMRRELNRSREALNSNEIH